MKKMLKSAQIEQDSRCYSPQSGSSRRMFGTYMKAGVLSAMLCVGAASQAHATLLAYEGFDYTAGEDLRNQNGGVGWSNDWSTANLGRAVIQNGGLSYLNLQVSGNSLGNPTTSGTTFTRVLANAPTSGSVYFSFLVAGDETTTGRYGALLRPTDGTAGPIAVGQSTGQSLDPSSDFTFRNDQANIGGLNAANAAGTPILGTNMVIVELNFDTNLAGGWLNPTSLGGAAPTRTWSNVAFSDPNELDPAKIVNQWFAGWQDAASTNVIYDEFRVGTTYGSVTPVPEPATYAMIFGAAALLTLVVRRRIRR